ncbi:MAG: hypothetical protein O7A69_10490 [SAR324 cluster bacterium]|nr:hypothetical protein [SAR324 cluster bacterium]
MTNQRRRAAFLSLMALAVLSVSILLGLVLAKALFASAPQVVYVTSEDVGMLSVVDASSRRLIRTIEIGHRPHNLVVNEDGLLLIATQGIDAVSVVDPRQEPVTVKRVGIGAPPHDLAVGGDGRTVFVGSRRGLLARFDPISGRIHQKVALGGSPHNVAVFGAAAWITDISSRRLLVVDEGSGALEVTISIVGHDIALRPGSSELWVTPWNGNHIVIVNAETRKEVAKVPVGRNPSHKHITFSAEGNEAWVTEPSSGRLFLVDARSRRTVNEVDLRGRPHHVRFAAGRVYVAVGPDELVVLDATSRIPVGRIALGSGVHGVGLSHSAN